MPTRIELTYRPQPKQLEFHLSAAQEVLYGGAAGGGKSEGLLNDAINYCLRYTGSTVGLFRRTFPELEKTLIKKFLEEVPETIAKYNSTKHFALFYPFTPHSSHLYFGSCQEENNVYQYQSVEFDYLGFDELTHFTEYQYTYLLSRLRSTKGFPLRVRSGTNPGNIGHAWVRQRFIDGHEPGEIWTDEFSGMTRCFIPAKVSDNPALVKADPAYLRRLNNLPETERRALKEGDWDVFAGQYFTNWRVERHVVSASEMTIPAFWARFFGFDYGYSNPTAVEWVARDYDGRLWVYRELYKAEMSEQEIAEEIKSLSGNEDVMGWPDPSIFAKRKLETGKEVSIADNLMKPPYNIRLTPAHNDRIGGWAKLRSYMEEAPACQYHRDKGWTSCPKLHVLSNCVNLIRTIPQLIHDQRKVEDVNTEGEDHAADALRYALTGVPTVSGQLQKQAKKVLLERQSRDFWA